SKYLDALLTSFSQRADLIEAIDNLSGGNVRTALGFLQRFVGSGHVETGKIIRAMDDTGRYFVALHEFMRAIIYGDNVYYDPSASPVMNLFDITSPDGREHFLTPIMLATVAK